MGGAAVTLNLAADGMPPPSGAMNGSEHQRQLTAVRGLAAFQVVVFHAGHFNGEWAVFFTACNGDRAVLLLFVLSGWLLGFVHLHRPFTSKNVKHYMLARAARIVPAYVVGLAAVSYLSERPGLFWLGATLQFGPWHLWTVPLQLHFYLAFVVLWWLSTMRTLRTFAAVALAVGYALALAKLFLAQGVETQAPWRFCPSWLSSEWYICSGNAYCFTAYAPFFVLGAWLGARHRSRGAHAASGGWASELLGPLFLLAVCVPFGPMDGLQKPLMHALANTNSGDGVFPFAPRRYVFSYLNPYNVVCAVGLVMCAASGPRTLAPVLESRVLQFLGDLSFGIYVYHFIARYIIHRALDATSLAILLYFGASVVVARLSLVYFERPLMRLVQNGDWQEVCRGVARRRGLWLATALIGVLACLLWTSELGGAIAAVLLAIASGTEEGIDAVIHAVHGLVRAGCVNADVASFDPDAVLPWARRARGAWADIHEELLAWERAASGAGVAPPFSAVDPVQVHLTPESDCWRTLWLRVYGGEAMAARAFPQTMSLLNDRRVSSAMFSILGAGCAIRPHQGLNNMVLRYHLGIAVPPASTSGATPERLSLRVAQLHPDGGADTRARLAAESTLEFQWANGSDLLFDDTFPHEVVNERTSGRRVVLFVDVVRQDCARHVNWALPLLSRALGYTAHFRALLERADSHAIASRPELGEGRPTGTAVLGSQLVLGATITLVVAIGLPLFVRCRGRIYRAYVNQHSHLHTEPRGRRLGHAALFSTV